MPISSLGYNRGSSWVYSFWGGSIDGRDSLTTLTYKVGEDYTHLAIPTVNTLANLTMDSTVKVAVVGSGLAGLTTNYLLSQPTTGEKGKTIETHLFEKVSCRPAIRILSRV